jgi:hypothetical protein
MRMRRDSNDCSRLIRFSSLAMLGMALVLSGCSAAAVQGASGLATSVGSAVTGFETAGSQRRVNNAQVQLTLANAELVRNQALDLELQRDVTSGERPVVVEVLRKTAIEEHDPFLNDIALWVSAGGDPGYAFRYLMDRERERGQLVKHDTLVVPPHPGQAQTTAPGAVPPHPGQARTTASGVVPRHPGQAETMTPGAVPPHPGQAQTTAPGT